MSTTVLAKAFPGISPDPAVRFLGQYKVERSTGSTATAITLGNRPIVGLEQVFKNGTLLDRELATPDYTIAGTILTLHTAPLTSDVIRVFYYFRTG